MKFKKNQNLNLNGDKLLHEIKLIVAVFFIHISHIYICEAVVGKNSLSLSLCLAVAFFIILLPLFTSFMMFWWCSRILKILTIKNINKNKHFIVIKVKLKICLARPRSRKRIDLVFHCGFFFILPLCLIVSHNCDSLVHNRTPQMALLPTTATTTKTRMYVRGVLVYVIFTLPRNRRDILALNLDNSLKKSSFFSDYQLPSGGENSELSKKNT
jgi:hypothetical protein